MKEQALNFFKLDMGITQDKRDKYFTALIEAAQKELERKGILLDEKSIDDVILLADYAAWIYRKRQEDIPISPNLQIRIRNRTVLKRSKENGNS